MKARQALLLATLLLVPSAAALRGASGPSHVRLNLGPGDRPYLSGFFPEYEIEAGVALQWSRPEARISLPLAFTGPAALQLRFGPPPGGPSRVDVVLGEKPLEGFECCRHRALQRRQLDASAGTATPVTARLRVSGPEIAERGLFLDWMQLDLAAGARLWLTGAARFRPAALVGLVFLLLWTAGFSATAAAAATTPLALGLSLALVRDPWLVHLLLRLLPEVVLFAALPLTVLGRLVAERGHLHAATLRAAVGLATLAFLGRAAALNHPDYFHPDLRTHARLVGVAREAGWDFLRAPARYLYTPREEPGAASTLIRTTSGLWLRRIAGVDVGLPYSLALHSLLAPLGLSGDATMSALKVLGAFFSAVEVAVLAFLAARLRASPLCALLLVAAPTALVELSLGMVPSAFGHALDGLFLLFLAARAPGLSFRRLALEGALFLAALQLAYVSSVLTTSLLVALLAALAFRGGDRVRAFALATALASGSLLALAVYYRDFVPGAFAAVRLAVAGRGAGAGGGDLDPGGGRVDAAFLLWGFPVLAAAAAAGYVLLLRRVGPERDVLLAWGLTLGVLGLLRRAAPGVFGFVHLSLFATPLACLAAGFGLEALRSRGGFSRVLAGAVVVVVCAQGVWVQIESVLGQLDNAR